MQVNTRKNSGNIKFYTYNSGSDQPDGTSFLSLLLCSIGMFMRHKLLIWISVFLIISTLCRKKYSSSIAQYLINVTMIIFALVSNYLLVPNITTNT